MFGIVPILYATLTWERTKGNIFSSVFCDTCIE